MQILLFIAILLYPLLGSILWETVGRLHQHGKYYH